ncbi:neuronal acetylcholine receptor subunit alpha-7 [Elysia marginata]|uniref:Neuronal acetylcholine receptor subunit alpha-7 n=1 Tax=Elysia marginata TaxID=1093978 RepID=A0AAV4I6E7_9GAST|nr:neuronal acetylcholine receptor subunit alpha-7 [Elysia marginata]
MLTRQTFPVPLRWLAVIVLALPTAATAMSATIDHAKDLYSNVILSEPARIRPVQNQSAAIEVSMSASILSLLVVDEVRQSISLNLLIGLHWTDEIRKWNATRYGGLTAVDVTTDDIWIPKLLNGNSVSKRDTFGTDYAPLSILNSGRVVHLPGGILHTSCLLDMTYYPFDSQRCNIQLFSGSTARFVTLAAASAKLDKESYIENPEWDLLSTSLEVGEVQSTSVAEFEIHIRRKPGHFVLTILVPINIISALSSLVFLTPVESGERVSFSITVLLALSVYTSEVSKGLPNNSETVPHMVVYLACLLLHAAVAIVINLVALMRHHSNKKSNRRSSNSGPKRAAVVGGHRSFDSESTDADYVSISDDQISELDSGEPKSGHGELFSNSEETKRSAQASSPKFNPSSSSEKGRPWKLNLTSMFVACARKLNYGETDFRSTVQYQWSGQNGNARGEQFWWRYSLVLWLLQFVGLVDLIMFVAFFSAWLIITVAFMAIFN